MGWNKTFEEALANRQRLAEKRKNHPKSKSMAARAGRKRSKEKREAKDLLEAEFKKICRERDGNQCRWIDVNGKRCTYKHTYIAVHHINEKSQRPDLRYDPKNGACICNAHHDQMHHTVQGRKEGRALGLLGGDTYESARKSS